MTELDLDKELMDYEARFNQREFNLRKLMEMYVNLGVQYQIKKYDQKA